jgi:hypothetical protein
LDEHKHKKWKTAILDDDDKAEFDKDICQVRHSACSSFVLMKEPYDVTCWRAHLKKCSTRNLKKKAASNTPSLFKIGFFSQAKKEDIPKPPKSSPRKIPCPGITKADHPKVNNYLQRTAALGGGGRSLPEIAKQLFKKCFSELQSEKKQKMVIDQQRHEWKWQNDHASLQVFSTSCEHQVDDSSPERPLPCLPCRTVLRSKAFQNIIKKPIPKAANYIFVNHRFRNPLLGVCIYNWPERSC